MPSGADKIPNQTPQSKAALGQHRGSGYWPVSTLVAWFGIKRGLIQNYFAERNTN